MTNSPHPPTSLLSRLIQKLTRRAGTVVILAMVLSVAAAISASRLQPVATIDAMVASDEPAAKALARLSHDFAAADELIILVSSPETLAHEDSNLNATDYLVSFAQRLSDTFASSPELSAMCNSVQWKPSSDLRSFIETHIIPNALLYLNDETITDLAQRLTPTSMRRQLRKTADMLSVPGGAGSIMLRSAMKDPLGLRDFLISALPRPFGAHTGLFSSDQGFFSKDGKHLLIRLRGVSPVSDLNFAGTFTRAARKVATSINKDNLDLVFTGAYAIAATAHQSIRADMIRSIVLSILFLQMLYLLVYRNIWMLPAALAPVAIGILFGFGTFAMLGMNLSPMTAVIGAILAGLGIDYCIHIISHYKAKRALHIAHTQAIVDTLIDLTPALVATCITTVIGFFAISQSSVPALREFGALGVMGLVACLVLAVMLLPAILTLSPTRPQSSHTSVNKPVGSITSRMLVHAVSHRRIFLMLGGMVSVTAIIISFLTYDTRALFENDLTIMHPRPNEAMLAQRRIETLFPGAADPLLLYLEAQTPQDLLILAHQVEARIKPLTHSADHILGVFGLSSLLPDPTTFQQQHEAIKAFDVDLIIHHFDDALDDSPFNPDAFDTYRGFLRQLFSPQRIGLRELLNYPGITDSMLPITRDNSMGLPTEALTVIFTPKALGQRSQRNTTIEAVRTALADLDGATLTGITVIGYDTEKTIRHELGKLLGIAACVVLGWLFIQFRSLWATMMALLPAVFGMVVLLACMLLFNIKLNTFNLIALPLLVGIGVDDGIFLTMVARRAQRRSRSSEETVDAFSASCHAIGMTSLTTVLTFGTLAFTSTPAIQSLGLLLAIGVVASWIGAMWILMPLLAGQEN